VCRVQCLKYLVLASMLMESHVDPFNAQETKPYRTDPQIQAMTDLVDAYQESNINKFEKVLKASKATVLEDPFIRPYIEDLINVLRTQVCIAFCVASQAVVPCMLPQCMYLWTCRY
jgi:COP9 signalosome complex subunit 2